MKRGRQTNIFDTFPYNFDKANNEIVREFVSEFQRIKNEGPIPAINNGNRAVGDTFEKKIGIEMNNSQLPDYKGLIEIKARASNSALSLFTKILDFPDEANSKICEKYGKLDPKNNNRVFNGTIKMGKNRYGRLSSIYGVNVDFDIKSKDKKLCLIFNNDPNEYYFNLEAINAILQTKLQMIAIINADAEGPAHAKKFHYKECYLVHQWNLAKFLECLKERTIQYDFRIGEYKSGVKEGESHDHGPAFRLSDSEINLVGLQKIFKDVTLLD
jgi:hypothetical protein